MSVNTYDDDAALVIEFQTGDRQQSFTQLMDKHITWIYGLCRRISSSDAEDLCQDIFMQVYLDLPRLRCPQVFVAWLHKIAWRQLQKYSSREREHQPLDDFLASVTPWNAVLDNLLISDAISSLSVKHKQVVVLSLVYGYTESEVASILDIQLGTVKSRLHSSRKHLQAFLMRSEREMDMGVKERIIQEITKRIREFNDTCLQPVEEKPEILDREVEWWHKQRQADAENNARLYGISLHGTGMRMTRERIMSESSSFKGIPNIDRGIPDNAELMDIRDISRRLLVSPFTILKWIRQGMPCVDYYPTRRFDLNLIIKWLTDNAIDLPHEVTLSELDDLLRFVLKEVQTGDVSIDDATEILRSWLF